MLTPIFSVAQDDAVVTITMRTPYVRAEELELDVSGNVFKCHVRPYYLSLAFKQRLMSSETSEPRARWDVDSGEMTVVIKKETPGEHFDNLDMLTELLTQPKRAQASVVRGNGIEVLPARTDAHTAGETGRDEARESDDDFDWEIPQMLPGAEAAEVLLNRSKYGFNDRHHGVFASRQEYQTEMIDLKDADSVPASERPALRVAQEDEKFVEEHEHYLCDTLGAEEPLPSLLSFVSPWEETAAARVGADKRKEKTKEKSSGGEGSAGGGSGGRVVAKALGEMVQVTVENELDYAVVDAASSRLACQAGAGGWGDGLNAEERDTLMKLPRREFILSKHQKKRVLIGLVDILFSFAHDERSTMCEGNVESGWAIAKLSASLSWFDTQDSVEDAVYTSVRRALAFPLYRSWDLACKVVEDVRIILSLGRLSVLRALLKIRRILSKGERYILNNLYIDDYLCWLQALSDESASKKLAMLVREIAKVLPLQKHATKWHLDLLETEALGGHDDGGQGRDRAGESDMVVASRAAAEDMSDESNESSSSSSSSSFEDSDAGSDCQDGEDVLVQAAPVVARLRTR